ncbi:MAG TPA: maleylpyruvate isomerase family mycothiol-dependent enzyme [Acidimicrobiia bacterium]|nr:maleylpyruvate isomerase family mycothiol-dependent enzyme [Acidimicrobiia bacterium]
MALPRSEVTIGLLEELERFKGLVQWLTPAELATPSRCRGWTVGDVAAHVIGGMADVAAFRLEGLGTPEVTARQVAERRGRSAGELADELGATIKATADLLTAFNDEAWGMQAPGGFDFTLGEGVEALWHDAWLHGDDILVALGRPSVLGDGMTASVSHIADVLTREGWGPAVLALDGLPEFAVNLNGGNGRNGVSRFSGDPLAFVYAATGRGDPAPLGLDESANIYR